MLVELLRSQMGDIEEAQKFASGERNDPWNCRDQGEISVFQAQGTVTRGFSREETQLPLPVLPLTKAESRQQSLQTCGGQVTSAEQRRNSAPTIVITCPIQGENTARGSETFKANSPWIGALEKRTSITCQWTIYFPSQSLNVPLCKMG